MNIRQENGKRILSLNFQDYQAIGKQAGWMGDYWKGLQQVRQIRQQKPQNREAYWRAFESTPGIGKALADYLANLKQDWTYFGNIIRESQIHQKIKANPAQARTLSRWDSTETAQRIQAIYNQLSQTGQQILWQAMQNLKTQHTNGELRVEQMADIGKEAQRLASVMYQEAKTQNLDFSRPEAYSQQNFDQVDRLIEQILALPTDGQVKIVSEIMNRLENAAAPAPPPSVPPAVAPVTNS